VKKATLLKKLQTHKYIVQIHKMKQLLFALTACTLLNSCVTLYTAPQQPVPFLAKEDGTAYQGSIAASGNTIAARAAVTKPINDKVNLHASLSQSLIAFKGTPYNPYTKSKADGHYSLGLGYTLTKHTGYPLQLWGILHGGRSKDSYGLFYNETPISKDVLLNTSGTDTTVFYEYIKGGYFGARAMLTAVMLSNYDNNATLRRRKNYAFDVIGNLSYTPMRYRYSNGAAYTRQTNNLLGFSTSARLAHGSWIVSLNNDFVYGIKPLTDEILGRSNDGQDFWQYTYHVGSISFAKLIK
jgi:hypothetical protein